MDNSNNSNSGTNPNQSSSGSTPLPVSPNFSSPYDNPVATPIQTPSQTDPLNQPSAPSYQSDTFSASSSLTPTTASQPDPLNASLSPWDSNPTPLQQPETSSNPWQAAPLSEPKPTINSTPTWTPPQPPTQPDLTNTQPNSPAENTWNPFPQTPVNQSNSLATPNQVSSNLNEPNPQLNMSNHPPLANPWEIPATTSPTMGTIPQPVNTNSAPTAPGQSNWMNNTAGSSTSTISNPSENIPTDLSHLISSNNLQDSSQQPAPTPETLVVSQANTISPEIPTLPTEEHKGLPKWLIGVGIGLLVITAAASAYFILGIGQPAKTTTSIPAVTQNSQSAPTVKNTPPIVTPLPQATSQPSATGSANFGALGGSSQTLQATSAADLIRQRQQQSSPKP